MAGVEVRPARAEAWPDLERVLGRAGGSNGCWCQYWLLGPAYRERDRDENRRDLERQVAAGDAGLLAYRDGEPVAWARFGPRARLRWLAARFRSSELPPGEPWSLSCLYVAPAARGDGTMRALIRHAACWGDAEGVPVEAYPIDAAVPGATGNRFSGVLSAFVSEGFVEVGRLARDRAIVRHE